MRIKTAAAIIAITASITACGSTTAKNTAPVEQTAYQKMTDNPALAHKFCSAYWKVINYGWTTEMLYHQERDMGMTQNHTQFIQAVRWCVDHQ